MWIFMMAPTCHWTVTLTLVSPRMNQNTLHCSQRVKVAPRIPESYFYSLINLDSRAFPPPPPLKKFSKKKVEYQSFNLKWFDNKKWSTWLHWDSETEKAYCFMCQNIYLLNQLTFSKCAESAFISSGFDTWKNASN